jgi:flagellar hook assembly protein FlgD
MRPARTAAVAVLTAALTATPLVATSTTAHAAAGTGRVIAIKDAQSFLSPNGDHRKDKTRIRYSLAKKSEVTVKVRRANKAQTLVYKEKLGKVTAGHHGWTWKGQNRNGKVVGDGEYVVLFAADQVAKDGQKWIRGARVHVHAKFMMPPRPTVNSDTVYPNTTIVGDAIGITLGDNSPEPTVGRVKMLVQNPRGRIVRTEADGYKPWVSYPVLFDGRDNDGDVLPAGQYQVRFKVWDKSGNVGMSKRVTVHVSGRPLVETTGSAVLPPDGGATILDPRGLDARGLDTRGLDGRESTTGGDDPRPVPCGKVVPSEVYPDPGAVSLRSSDACGGTELAPSIATIFGTVELDDAMDAPRGLTSAWMFMRGKPTVDGETDTAEVQATMFGASPGAAATSEPVAGESVTTTGPARARGWHPSWTNPNDGLYWSLTTHGTDSYDVAALTVHYTYLTPQGR